MIWTWMDGMGIRGEKPWHLSPPSNAQCPDVQFPVAQSDMTVWECQWGWWLRRGEIGSLGLIYAEGHLVLTMEFRYKLLQPLDIFHQSPFILFNPISLPVYQVFKFPLEHVALQNMFNFVLNSITDYQWGKITLDVFGDGVWIVGPQQCDWEVSVNTPKRQG